MRETLLNNFLRISRIPRGSGNEQQIADFFMDVAKKNDLYCFKDAYNNVLIKKSGTIPGEPFALQAHLDMVCVQEKEGVHDFLSQGIDVIVDGDRVTARGTTLGADQGVGLAIMLTIMENNHLKHPDLEFLFTTEEETTFQGAVSFPYSMISSKRLINLDTDRDDVVVIGSDGDILNEYSFQGNLLFNHLPSYKVLIDGFMGGNSGNYIEESIQNAISTMANILNGRSVYLKSIHGGTFESDLATSCEVILHTEEDIEEMFQGVSAKIEVIDNELCFSKEDTKNIINKILELKCGFLSSFNSSANLGMIRTFDDTVKMYYIFRSIDRNELAQLDDQLSRVSCGFSVHRVYEDSIWEIDRESRLLKQYKEIYYKEFREYPREEICHAGTECSSIKKRVDDLDIISIGATMEKIHTCGEITYVSSWLKVYRLLIQLLEVG